MKKIYSAILLSIAVLSGCGSSQKDGKVKLSGAGATFPAPFYNNLFKSFSENSVHQVTYGAIGSGGGIRSLKDKTIDFGATDVFLSDDELKEMGAEVIHIPTALGAVVLSYNLPEIKDAKLKLSSELVSDIFRGTITKWNDAKIKAINPDLNLPDKTITPVYRSDGSGTTYVFSDYMSKTDENWQKDLGSGKVLNFSVGVAAKGNPGVAGVVSETSGAIGYIGSEYALALNLTSALMQNSAGNFIEANSTTISAAANVDMPADTRIMITNSPEPEAYPISTFTWLILYKEQSYNNRSVNTAKALKELLCYVISEDGQQIAVKTHYAPLSPLAVEKTKAIIESMTYGGNPVVLDEKTDNSNKTE